MASAARRPTVLLQIALFVVIAAVIINSSVCLGAVVVGPGALDPNRPAFPSPGGGGKPYTGGGRGCRTIYGCGDVPPAGGQP
ncbi:protein WIR1A-like [Triticum dicoccoides]|uniref:protein WIR1A-like n=1 Tax=Triticum dicoccoides TaxID=85692 RepID=UPI00188DCACE|nr:protein WIR1A-like [Triticum dicoccoides]